MINYSDILKLYGTPISQIPVPFKPRQFSKIQIVIGTAVVVLAIIGVYKLIKPYGFENIRIKEPMFDNNVVGKNEKSS
ncbi:MAG: hypothetical protein ACO1G9_13525 [Bacteroidota bacterium]